MMQRILVPLDGSEVSEQILPLVTSLAKAFGSEVHLLYVVDTGGLPMSIQWKGEMKVDQLVLWQQQRGEAYLQGVEAGLRERGVRSRHTVATDAPALAIATHAEADASDLIAMSTHGRSGLSRWTLGSVADKVLRTARVPLLLHHPKDHEQERVHGVGAVLLPLDGTVESAAAIPLAVRLAEGLHVPLRIARVAAVYPMVFGMESPHVYAEVLQGITQEASDYLETIEVQLKAKGASVETKLLVGDAATCLLEWASESPGALMVMTTHGRSGLGRAVLGSVTDKVARSGAAPVVVIAPDAVWRVDPGAHLTVQPATR